MQASRPEDPDRTGAMAGELPLNRGLLLIRPQVLGVPASLVVLFAAAHVSPVRAEVRALAAAAERSQGRGRRPRNQD